MKRKSDEQRALLQKAGIQESEGRNFEISVAAPSSSLSENISQDNITGTSGFWISFTLPPEVVKTKHLTFSKYYCLKKDVKAFCKCLLTTRFGTLNLAAVGNRKQTVQEDLLDQSAKGRKKSTGKIRIPKIALDLSYFTLNTCTRGSTSLRNLGGEGEEGEKREGEFGKKGDDIDPDPQLSQVYKDKLVISTKQDKTGSSSISDPIPLTPTPQGRERPRGGGGEKEDDGAGKIENQKECVKEKETRKSDKLGKQRKKGEKEQIGLTKPKHKQQVNIKGVTKVEKGIILGVKGIINESWVKIIEFPQKKKTVRSKRSGGALGNSRRANNANVKNNSDSARTIYSIDSGSPFFESLRQILLRSQIFFNHPKWKTAQVEEIGIRTPSHDKGTFFRGPKYFLKFQGSGEEVFVEYNDCFCDPKELSYAQRVSDVQNALAQDVKAQKAAFKNRYWDEIESTYKAELEDGLVPEGVIHHSRVEYHPEGTKIGKIIEQFFAKYKLNYEMLFDKLTYRSARKIKIEDETILEKWKSFHKKVKLNIHVANRHVGFVDQLVVRKVLREEMEKKEKLERQETKKDKAIAAAAKEI